MEDPNNPAGFVTVPSVTNTSNYDESFDVSIVDGSDRTMWDDTSGREYTFEITELCDALDNCSTGTPIRYLYAVYANASNTLIDAENRVIDTAELTNWNIADGQAYQLRLQIKDPYGNDIIPALAISRTIDFDITANNHLALDQYTYGVDINTDPIPANTWDSSVFYGPSHLWLLVGTGVTQSDIKAIPVNSTDKYEIDFSIYTPTSKWNGNFELLGIEATEYSIFSSLTSGRNIPIISPQIDFDFTPLYTTTFGGSLKDDGFVEWVTQSGTTIAIEKSTSSTTTTSNSIYLKFGSIVATDVTGTETNDVADAFELRYSTGSNTASIIVSQADNLSSLFHTSPDSVWFITAGKDLKTRLDQIKSIATNQSTYLSTHVSYTIADSNGDPLEVVYNSDVIWEYLGWNIGITNTVQSTAKIIGKIHSQSLKQNVGEDGDEQFKQYSFGRLSKSQLRANIKKQVFDIVKNSSIDFSFGSNEIQNLGSDTWQTEPENDLNENQLLWNNDIVYFGAGWDDVILKDDNATPGDGGIAVNENKTLVVIGRNVYIQDNMYYQWDEDMLGIIVLKDESGNGWNIYIHPEVTNIVGTMFAEGALMSYDHSNGWEISWNATQDQLKNQLHIYGSVFSENTIGWASVLDENDLYSCPFNITELCTKQLAQKYDLNYLRRYQLYNVGYTDPVTLVETVYQFPMNNGKVAGNRLCSSDASNFSSNNGWYFPCLPTASIYEWANNWIYEQGNLQNNINLAFPVIIKYNPQVQLTPPPLFSE